jgi:hypothetical protein
MTTPKALKLHNAERGDLTYKFRQTHTGDRFRWVVTETYTDRKGTKMVDVEGFDSRDDALAYWNRMVAIATDELGYR